MIWYLILAIFMCCGFFSPLFGMKSIHKKPYNRNNQLGLLIKRYIENFSSNSFVLIEISGRGYSERFDVFPFLSNYEKTQSELKENSNSLHILRSLQKKYDRTMADFVRKIYSIFNSNLLFIGIGHEIFYSAYESFMKDAFKKFTNIFAKKYIPMLFEKRGSEINTMDVLEFQNFKMELNQLIIEKFGNDLSDKARMKYQEEMYKNFTNSSWNQYSSQDSSYKSDNLNEDEIQKAYNTLEISSNCSNDEIKKAYRKLSKKYHPDVNPSKDAQEKMMLINAAYDILKKHRNIDK